MSAPSLSINQPLSSTTTKILNVDDLRDFHQGNRINNWLFIIFCLIFVLDIMLKGFGGKTNTRMISLLDSLSHCSNWALIESCGPVELQMGLKILGAFFSKYGSGVITSSLLNLPAPFTQKFSWFSFLFANLLIHNRYSLARDIRSPTGKWRVLFVSLSSLYKCRKLRLVLQDAQGFKWRLLIGVLSMELTGVLNVALRHYWSHQSFAMSVYAVGSFIFRYRLRLVLTIAAILNVNSNSFVLIALIALHKSCIPIGEYGEGGLSWQFF